jgi:hypothetical protein
MVSRSLQALYVKALVGEAVGCDVQGRVTVANFHRHVTEPGADDQVHWLRHDRVEPHHLPEHPAVHGPGITVPRESGQRVGVVGIDRLPRT